MLAQVTRKILDHLIQLKEFFYSWLKQIKSSIAKLTFTRIFRIFPFPGVNQTGKARKSVVVKIQRLSDFTRSRTSAICNDVRCHSGTKLSITFVDILDCFFTLIAAWQIEINVGPLTSFFGKKSFEKKFHAYWIDSCDPERVTNGAVCC